MALVRLKTDRVQPATPLLPLSQHQSKWIDGGVFTVALNMVRALDNVNKISSETLTQSNYDDDQSTCEADRRVNRMADFQQPFRDLDLNFQRWRPGG